MSNQRQCPDCGRVVTELGSFVKESTHRWHLECFLRQPLEAARREGRSELLAEQNAEIARKLDIEKARRKQAFEMLPRCARCGAKMGSGGSTEFGQVKLPANGTAGVCAPCVTDELRTRSEARTAPAPGTVASLMQPRAAPAPGEKKPEEPPRDRFSLLDLD